MELDKVDSFIDGRPYPPENGEYGDKIDPRTNTSMKRVAQGGVAELDRAVAAAAKAQTDWADLRPVHPLVSHTPVPVYDPLDARELDPWNDPEVITKSFVEAVATISTRVGDCALPNFDEAVSRSS